MAVSEVNVARVSGNIVLPWTSPSSSLSIVQFDGGGHEALLCLAQAIIQDLESDGILIAWHNGGDEPLCLFVEGDWESGSPIEREMTEMTMLAGNMATRTPHSQWRMARDCLSDGLMTTCIPVDDGLITVTSLFKQVELTTRRRVGQIATRALPLIQPFFKLWISRARSTLRAEALAEVIDHSDVGVFVVNSSGHVTFANGAAETIIGRKDGLRRQGSMLAATRFADTLRLQAMIEHVISREASAGPAPVVALNKSNGRPLMATVFPVKAESSDLLESGAIIYVFDPDLDLHAALAPVCKLHGLSPVETRLACMIADGMSLADAAKATRVRELTARSYLKQVFLKTGTKRQAELVALLLKSAVRTSPEFPTKLI